MYIDADKVSEQDDELGRPLSKKHAWSECDQIDDLESQEQNQTEIDALANAFTWGTTTQRYSVKHITTLQPY